MLRERALLLNFASLLLCTMSLSSGASTVVRLSEKVWRKAASEHQDRILTMLRPGLTSPDDILNSGIQRQKDAEPSIFTALNPKNPVYNFLIEYYGLKGVKGVKRLARWSPEPQLAGVLLEGASPNDFSSTLHLKGAIFDESGDGVLYSASDSFRDAEPKAANPYLWYRSVLQQTLTAAPVLYCHGLHEYAMMYQPIGAPEPPSAKYQAHLKLRVDRSTINEAVERKGIRCTHVDALRYFAPAAGPLNEHGATLLRMDQLVLEQPACVHAHMDLLKIALRLQPFVGASLLQRVLKTAIAARTLDVAASPYDATMYNVGVVPIETAKGRAEYRDKQAQLMELAEPVRRDLLQAYNVFLDAAFSSDTIAQAKLNPQDERFAKSAPGGFPWRKNLLA